MNKNSKQNKKSSGSYAKGIAYTIDLKDQLIHDLSIIKIKEPEAFSVLEQLIEHIAGTYGDKYQQEGLEWIQTKGLLLGVNGKFPNIHSASKYIQRYSSVGMDKSENPYDLLKAIHYLMFEMQRINKHGRTQNNNKDK